MFGKVVHIAYKRPDFVMINREQDSNLLTYLLTYSMEQSPSLGASRFDVITFLVSL
jgi:hypothetical protein